MGTKDEDARDPSIRSQDSGGGGGVGWGGGSVSGVVGMVVVGWGGGSGVSGGGRRG